MRSAEGGSVTGSQEVEVRGRLGWGTERNAGGTYAYSIAFMKFSGSPAGIVVSNIAREVTGRRPEASGRSRNWSVQLDGVKESVIVASLLLIFCKQHELAGRYPPGIQRDVIP